MRVCTCVYVCVWVREKHWESEREVEGEKMKERYRKIVCVSE